MTKNLPAVQLELFEDQPVRREMHNGEWHWSVIDAIAALTESKHPGRYWTDLKRRLAAEGADQSYAKIVQLKMLSPDGKRYKTNAADLETLFRIIQSVPSPKAEPFKQWLAKVAAERVKEEANPDLTIRRGVRRYKALGMTDEQVKARLDAILTRNELTAEWKLRGVGRYSKWDFPNLTNQGYRKVFGCDAKSLCARMGLKPKSNPRDAMDPVALQVLSLHETLAVAITRRDNLQGYHGCKDAVIEAGTITRQTADTIEAALGKPLIPFTPTQKKLSV